MACGPIQQTSTANESDDGIQRLERIYGALCSGRSLCDLLRHAGNKWSVYVGAALCSVIAVHQMISFAFALELRLRSRRIDEDLTPAVHSAQTGFVAQIEGRDTNRILNMPSVTEDTTAILQDAPRHVTTKPRD